MSPGFQLDERVRAGADRVVPEVGVRLGRRRRHHHPGTVGEDAQQRAVGLVEVHRDLVLTRRLDRLDGADVRLDRRVLQVLGPLDVVDDGLGVERRPVVERDALLQGHRQRLRVGELPALGEERLRLQRRRVAVQQAVVDRVQRHVVAARRPPVRVERRRLGHRRVAQDAAVRVVLDGRHRRRRLVARGGRGGCRRRRLGRRWRRRDRRRRRVGRRRRIRRGRLQRSVADGRRRRRVVVVAAARDDGQRDQSDDDGERATCPPGTCGV